MKTFKELRESLGADMASFLQKKGMNAKLTTTDQKKKETADLMAKRAADAANKPKPAPAKELSPEEKKDAERKAMYGGDPDKRPWGLGS